MIAAEASLWDTSSVDAALFFLDMAEMEETGGEWDPRLIGAVLDALARVGRAADAQALLGRALRVDISNFDSGPNNEAGVAVPGTNSTKQLNPSRAGPCFDALLRAWSKQAMLLAQAERDDATVKQ